MLLSLICLIKYVFISFIYAISIIKYQLNTTLKRERDIYIYYQFFKHKYYFHKVLKLQALWFCDFKHSHTHTHTHTHTLEPQYEKYMWFCGCFVHVKVFTRLS